MDGDSMTIIGLLDYSIKVEDRCFDEGVVDAHRPKAACQFIVSHIQNQVVYTDDRCNMYFLLMSL